MKSLNKFALAVVAVVVLATPALAAHSRDRAYQQRPTYDMVQQPAQQVGTYPNGAARTGTADSTQSGAEFNLLTN